jgi:Tetratricopeptide repeat
MRRLIVFLVLSVLVFCGCEKQQEPSPPMSAPAATGAKVAQTSTSGAPILTAAIDPVVTELPTEALSTWRRHAAASPELVLFSLHPFLEAIPEPVKIEALAMVQRGDAAEIRAHGSFFRENPLLLPTQALRAALEAGWFSQVTWVVPSPVKVENLSLETFRAQVVEGGFLTAEEGTRLTLTGGIYSGEVQGVPFRAVHPATLPAIDGPVVVHLDLGYFSGLYQDEVKTPLYDLLHELATSLQQTGWRVPAVTLSYSTVEGVFSLDSRFLLTNFAEILRKPEMLNNNLPELWRLRAEALYGADMFQPQKMKEMHQQAAALAPQDATAQYDLYKILFENREIGPALETLDRVVAMDPGYAAAYLELAQIARTDKNPAAALGLLEKAAKAFPENPFINLHRAEILLESGEKKAALELLEPLSRLHWSGHYHGDTPGLIADMAKGKPAAPAPQDQRP